MMGGDISHLFNNLLGISRPVDYETILSSPNIAEANFVRSALNILTDPTMRMNTMRQSQNWP